MARDHQRDIEAIEKTIEDMFAAISWSAESPPDWKKFAAPALEGAVLAPSARPAALKGMEEFVAGMKNQRDSGNLVDFEERVLGHHVRVFGNIAVALSSYASRINEGDEMRGVNAFLLVKTEGSWRIAGMAWDGATEERPLPDDLAP